MDTTRSICVYRELGWSVEYGMARKEAKWCWGAPHRVASCCHADNKSSLIGNKQREQSHDNNSGGMNISI